MPGELTGHTVPLMILAQAPSALRQLLDHTYVTSDAGHAWGCHGQTSGGRVICTGLGSADQADCLAQPDAEAGIFWFVSGMCHQMANRILWPAGGLIVTAAGGYNASSLMFGTYGLDLGTFQHYSPTGYPWPELVHCIRRHQHP